MASPLCCARALGCRVGLQPGAGGGRCEWGWCEDKHSFPGSEGCFVSPARKRAQSPSGGQRVPRASPAPLPSPPSQDQQRLRTSTHLYSSSLISKITSSFLEKKKKQKQKQNMQTVYTSQQVWWGFVCLGQGCAIGPTAGCVSAGSQGAGVEMEFKTKPKTERKKTKDHRIPLQLKKRKGHFFAIVTNIPSAHLTA